MRRQRQRAGVLARRLPGHSRPGRRARAARASVSAIRSTRPTCVSGSGPASSCWTHQCTSSASPSGSAATKRAEVLDDAGRRRGHAREPRAVAERVDEARLAQQELGLPRRPQPPARVADDEKRSQSGSAHQPLLARRPRSGRAGAPAPRRSCRGRSGPTTAPGSVDCAKRLRRRSRPARLSSHSRLVQPAFGHRKEQHPPLAQHDRVLEHVLRERRSGIRGTVGRRRRPDCEFLVIVTIRRGRAVHTGARCSGNSETPHLSRRARRTGRSLILVAGSGRSGTSLFTGIVQRLGYAVPQPEVPADDTNPRGFGESQWVVDFHTQAAPARRRAGRRRPAGRVGADRRGRAGRRRGGRAAGVARRPVRRCRSPRRQGPARLVVPPAVAPLRGRRRREPALRHDAPAPGGGDRLQAALVRRLAERGLAGGRVAEPDAVHGARHARGAAGVRALRRPARRLDARDRPRRRDAGPRGPARRVARRDAAACTSSSTAACAGRRPTGSASPCPSTCASRPRTSGCWSRGWPARTTASTARSASASTSSRGAYATYYAEAEAVAQSSIAAARARPAAPRAPRPWLVRQVPARYKRRVPARWRARMVRVLDTGAGR